MAGDYKTLVFSDVSEGDTLPELSYDVSASTVVLGALASRDWRPMHHDKDFAVDRNGVKNIFLNTPNLAAWFERYMTDWTGPKGRLGRMTFRMRDSVFPGETMVFRGKVENVEKDDNGCGWAEVAVEVSIAERTCTTCAVRIALPTDASDNPWARKGDAWRP